MKKSGSATSLSDLPLDEIMSAEKVRYKRKGYGIVFAFIIFALYFFVLPDYLKKLWPEKIENGCFFQYWSILVFHSVVFILINLAMYVIYHIEHPFFEKYKVNNKPWPWNEDREKWNETFYDSIRVLVFNQAIILPILSLAPMITKDATYRYDLESLPSNLENAGHILFFMIVEDFTFYWGHRFLHWDKIYAYIHKMHHKYQNTISIASEYAHPVEFVLTNIITSNLGNLILGKRTHLFTVYLWVFLRVAESTDGHCGYEFSWSPYRLIPFSGSSEFHNYHHLYFKGNYGSFFSIWDTICNTVSIQYKNHIKRQEMLDSNYETELDALKKDHNQQIDNIKKQDLGSKEYDMKLKSHDDLKEKIDSLNKKFNKDSLGYTKRD